jgi:organic radical activating enzyme
MINQTYCSKAWTDVNIDFSKRTVRHCCKSESEQFPATPTIDFFNNSPGIVQRRNDLITGIQNSQCSFCWDSYKTTGSAYRDSVNTNEINPPIKYVEVLLDNICDMACLYCSADSSHKIAQEQGLAQKVSTPDENDYAIFFDWLATINSELRLSFLGGEPTYSKNFYKFINMMLNDDRFNQKEIRIIIITNGNTSVTMMDKFLNLVDSFPLTWKFIITVSNESTHHQSELVRHGLKWDTFETNVKRYLSHPRLFRIALCPTLCVLTLDYFDDFLTWFFALVRQYNKKVVITGNSVNDGMLTISKAALDNKSVVEIYRNNISQNSDLIIDVDSVYNWLDQIYTAIGSETLDTKAFNDFITTKAQQKSDPRVSQFVLKY